MISDSERRAVAARMREILRDDPHGWLDAMVMNAVTDVLGEGVAIGGTVADLIDRPTCHISETDHEFVNDWTMYTVEQLDTSDVDRFNYELNFLPQELPGVKITSKD